MIWSGRQYFPAHSVVSAISLKQTGCDRCGWSESVKSRLAVLPVICRGWWGCIGIGWGWGRYGEEVVISTGPWANRQRPRPLLVSWYSWVLIPRQLLNTQLLLLHNNQLFMIPSSRHHHALCLFFGYVDYTRFYLFQPFKRWLFWLTSWIMKK